MPQMAPMSWLNLFIMFTITFLIFNSLNYFSFLYPPKSMKLMKMLTKNNWKW
uniref:ATP synthase complex subunit 8 n=1 Tax=Euryusa optabilis TaxID=878090 RepID=A0A0S2M7D7_9COLE|nr:ATP synthase F0 subunit 8 [Euryusa optabilis]ALO70561.1 ATP synthase F0 subunit 8 [Euryusa optabilis]